MNELERMRRALARIADVAREAANGEDYQTESESGGNGEGSKVAQKEKRVCTPKSLPKHLLIPAAQTAIKINPVDAPVLGPLAAVGASFDNHPQFIAVLTSKYWGPQPRRLTVSFMEQTSSDLRKKILSHMNAWNKTACIRFEWTQETGMVRISREADGYWSYLGTDITHIDENHPTMSLQGFSMSTPDSEYRRVVRHETGHTLGCPHEHMRKALVKRIDPEKAYEYFWETQGWDKHTVDQQVLTPLNENSLMATAADQTSIMCYQLPGLITYDGEPILGGDDINKADYEFAGKIYPKPGHEPMAQQVLNINKIPLAEPFLAEPRFL